MAECTHFESISHVPVHLCDGCVLIRFLPHLLFCYLRSSQCQLLEALLHQHLLPGVDVDAVSLFRLRQLRSQCSVLPQQLPLQWPHHRLDVAGVAASLRWRLRLLDSLRNRTR